MTRCSRKKTTEQRPTKKSIQIRARGQKALRNLDSGKMWTDKLTEVLYYNKMCFSVLGEQLKL